MSPLSILAAAVLAAQITASAPATVEIDHRVPVHGHVRVADERRPVRLQERTTDGWHVLATERSTRTGRFRFSVPAGHALTERVFRVVAPRSGQLGRARTSPFRVRVVYRTDGTVVETPAPRAAR